MLMYVVHPPQDGLLYLNDNDGWLGYVLLHLLLVIVCITLTYIKPIICGVSTV
ncbi:MAG: hypothetical protein IJ437_02265 [Clostridia bacterium]|nr:hypothetical protein [Clostridia bacterium]